MSAVPPTAVKEYIAVPSDRAWLDPHLLVTIFETVFKDVFVPTNGSTLIAPPDPGRAVLGITFPNAVSPGAAFGPWPDPATFITAPISSGTTALYTVREHYTMPTLGWYVQSAQNMTFRVMTVRRR